MFTSEILFKALIIGAIWATTYIFIRRFLNPEIGWVLVGSHNRVYVWDAVFGGLAMATNTVLILTILQNSKN